MPPAAHGQFSLRHQSSALSSLCLPSAEDPSGTYPALHRSEEPALNTAEGIS